MGDRLMRWFARNVILDPRPMLWVTLVLQLVQLVFYLFLAYALVHFLVKFW